MAWQIRGQLSKLPGAIRGADLEALKPLYAPEVVSVDSDLRYATS